MYLDRLDSDCGPFNPGTLGVCVSLGFRSWPEIDSENRAYVSYRVITTQMVSLGERRHTTYTLLYLAPIRMSNLGASWDGC